jgi:hypothetical protein
MKGNKFIYWAPRILSIIFILFLSLFSLDIFDMNLGFWGIILGLFMHNIPSIILIALLIVAWKYDIVGAIAFISAGILYIMLLLTSSNFELFMLSWILLISLPCFILGILWILSWKNKKKIKKMILGK